jgi:hypothetical protein
MLNFIKGSFNLKILNNLYNSISLNNILINNKFLIFCNLNKSKNLNLLSLRNEIKKLDCESFISNSRFVKIYKEHYDLLFLGSNILVIAVLNWKILCKLIHVLNNEYISFFFLHLNNLSRNLNIKIFEVFNNNFNKFLHLNFIIYRLIIRIFLILAVFIRSIFLLVTFNKK